MAYEQKAQLEALLRESMLEILQDIQTRLRAGQYQNEEHIRLSIVARIVAATGWNIWDPTEVFTEFKATATEDNTRVDMALFAKNFEADTVFIECKGHGRIGDDLPKVERQLRDYNRNHSALFTIITDGQHWRFYFSLTSGEFAQKLFAKFDLLADELAELAEQFTTFLSKAHILSGAARHAAESYLMLSKKERVMKDLLPEAEKAITLPPYLALPDALVSLLAEKSLRITRDEAVAFLAGDNLPKPARVVAPAPVAATVAPVVKSQSKADQMRVFTLALLRDGIQAQGHWNAAGEFVVEAGSQIRAAISASMTGSQRKLREQLIQQKVLQEKNGQLLFKHEYAFKTAGLAAVIICGYSVNGKTIWKDQDGKALGEVDTTN